MGGRKNGIGYNADDAENDLMHYKVVISHEPMM
jgi:hypothetical protein